MNDTNSSARPEMPRNPADNTPTIVNGSPSSESDRPSTAESALNRRCQNASLRITTFAPPGVASSSALKFRPIAGRTPKVGR
jgi:hypothetical protein